MKTLISIITATVVLFICMLIADQGTFQIAVNGNNMMDFVSLAIFIFIVYFFITIKSWSPKAKKEIITAIVVYCCFNVYMVSTNFGIMCIKKSRFSARTKACWKNIKVIQSAVDMYNMDVATMTTTLNITELRKLGYLKSDPIGTEDKCHYDSYGDLTEDGFIYCSFHLVPGTDEETIENFGNSIYNSNSKIPQELINEFKKKRSAEKTFIGSIKESWPKIKVLLSPILVLFFPFSLHPLR